MKLFGLTQRLLRCSKSLDDGATCTVGSPMSLKTLGCKISKGIGSQMTKICPI